MGPDPQSPEVTASRPHGRFRTWWRFPKTWSEVRRLGWRAILAFVVFYLVRDVLLYIVVPYFIYRGATAP